jgi:WD40 repeat protein
VTDKNSSPEDPYLLALASRSIWRRTKDRLSKFFFGDDIFISYARADAAEYAAGLAAGLTKRRFICYLDQFGSKPDAEIPDELKEKLMRSTQVVLVGTRAAAASPNVRKEIVLFNRTGRAVIAVDADKVLHGEVERAKLGEGDWGALVGRALIEEMGERVRAGDPSPRVVDLVENSFSYRRRNQWQRFFLFAGSSFVALTVFASVLVSGFLITSAQTEAELIQSEARLQVQAARQASELAEQAERTATATADASKVAEVEAQHEAEGARLTRDLAVEQQHAAEQGMRRAQELERRASEAADEAARQEQGSRATLLTLFEPDRAFEALALAFKAAGPKYKASRPTSDPVFRGLVSAVNSTDYALPLEPPPGDVSHAELSPDGAKAFGEALDKSNEAFVWLLWDVRTGKRTMLDSQAPAGSPQSSFSRDAARLALALDPIDDETPSLYVWDVRGARPSPVRTDCAAPGMAFREDVLEANDGHAVALDADGSHVAMLLERLTVCEIATGKKEEVEVAGPPGFSPVAVAYTPKNELALYGLAGESSDRKSVVYFPRTDKKIEVAAPHEDLSEEEFFGFGDDGSIIMSGPGETDTSGGTTQGGVYIQSPGGDTRLLTGYFGSVYSAALLDNHVRVLTQSGNVMQVADARPDPDLLALRGHRQPLQSVSFSLDGRLLLTASGDGTARIWDASTGDPLHTLTVPDFPPPAGETKASQYKYAAFSPDGTRVVTANQGGEIQTWDTKTGLPICPVIGRRAAAAPPGVGDTKGMGRIFFRGGNDYLVTMHGSFRPPKGKDFNEQFADAILHPSENFSLIFWDARTCAPLKRYSPFPSEGNSPSLSPIDSIAREVSFSADGAYMMTTLGMPKRAKLWDLRRADLSGDAPMRLTPSELGYPTPVNETPPLSLLSIPDSNTKSHDYKVRAISFGGTMRILEAELYGPLQIWMPAEKKSVPLEGSQANSHDVFNAVFSADGTHLVMDSMDGLRVWDTRSGKLLMSLQMSPNAMALSADGRRLMIARAGSLTVRIYPTSGEGYFGVARRLSGR